MLDQHERAKISINRLFALGFSQKEIAARITFDQSTISRARNNPDWAVGVRLAEALEAAECECIRERLAAIIPFLKLTEVETCNDQNIHVNEGVRSELRQVMLDTLQNLLVPNSSSVPMPKGIAAAFAAVGDGMYLIKIDPQHTSDQDRLKLVIHELTHLLQRLRAKIPPTETPYYPKSEY